jgi:hypothetical protein
LKHGALIPGYKEQSAPFIASGILKNQAHKGGLSHDDKDFEAVISDLFIPLYCEAWTNAGY